MHDSKVCRGRTLKCVQIISTDKARGPVFRNILSMLKNGIPSGDRCGTKCTLCTLFWALCSWAGIFTGVVLYFEITSLFQDPIMSSCCVSRYELPDFANILWGKDISIFCPSTGHTASFIGACKKRWNQEVGGGGKVCGTPCKEVRWLPLTCAICTTGPWGTFVRRKGEGQWQRTIDPPSPLSMRVHTLILIHTMCGAHGQLETCHPCQCVCIQSSSSTHGQIDTCHRQVAIHETTIPAKVAPRFSIYLFFSSSWARSSSVDAFILPNSLDEADSLWRYASQLYLFGFTRQIHIKHSPYQSETRRIHIKHELQ